MTSRSRNLGPRAWLGVGAAVLALSGCSTDLHPGSAAVVGGTSITQGSVDDLVDAACVYTEEFRKQDSRVQKLDLAQIRSTFLTGMVQAEITRQVADDQGLSVSESQVDQLAAQSVNSIPDSVPDDDKDVLSDFFDEQAETSILQAVIGKHRDDPTVLNGNQVTSDEIAADKPFMQGYFEDADVDVSPGYGHWNGSTLDEGTGSLSQRVSTPSATPAANTQCG